MTFDYSRLPDFELFDDPGAWEVQGLGDDVLIIYAGCRGREGDVFEYDLLLKGRPPVLLPVAFAAPATVEHSYTEAAEERPANDFDWSTALGTRFAAAPDRWQLELADGHELVVYANDKCERDGEHVFTLAVQGGGPSLPIARLSSRLIVSVKRVPATPEASPGPASL